jgi:hypothetical protein
MFYRACGGLRMQQKMRLAPHLSPDSPLGSSRLRQLAANLLALLKSTTVPRHFDAIALPGNDEAICVKQSQLVMLHTMGLGCFRING